MKHKSFRERNRQSGGYLLKSESRKIGYKVVRFFLLFAICSLILHPLLDKFSVSVMEERDLYDSSITIFPRHLTWEKELEEAKERDKQKGADSQVRL